MSPTNPPAAAADQPAARTVFAVEGMHCAACVRRVERVLVSLDGVVGASADFLTGRTVLEVVGETPNEAEIAAAVERIGYRLGAADEPPALEPDCSQALRATAALALGWAIFTSMQINRWAELGWDRDTLFIALFAVATPTLIIVGRPIAAQGVRIRNGANMDTLILLGVAAAWGYSTAAAFAGWAFKDAGAAREVFFDTALIIIGFVSLGRWLEARVKRRASAAAANLLSLRPPQARIIRGDVQLVEVDEVLVGDRVLIRPGERLAVDGVVISGVSAVDEALLTGESAAVTKGIGDRVFAGTINLDGAFTYSAEQVGAGTALARIAAAVERAQASKAPIQRLADRIAAVFVPAVISVAILAFVLWAAFGPPPAWTLALITAVAVLVVACPCALGLATPAAIAAGAGRAASLGLLFRDAEALERAARVDTVVFDKTGTLTIGRHRVVAIEPNRVTMQELLALAALVEAESEHPLAAAVVEYAREHGIEIEPVEQFRAYPGRGAVGRIGGREIAVGNLRLLEELGIEAAPAANDQGTATAVHVAADGRRIGVIWTADELKAGATAAVDALRRRGLSVLLVTGDSEAVARAVAERAGIDDIHAETLPEEKARVIAGLQKQGRVVTMVGDGLNDAPALAQADLGIALRSGADITLDASQATLIRDDPGAVAEALGLARATRRTISQNLGFAFGYNVLLIPLAAGIGWPIFSALGGVPSGLHWLFGEQGAFEPLAAAAAMMLSSLTVLVNALRLQRWRPAVDPDR